MFISDELLDAAAETVDTKSVWTAHDADGKRWNWTLDSHRAFGQVNFRHWCERVCSRGYPARFFWRRKATGAELLLDVTMWAEDADAFEDNDYSNQDIPSFARRGHDNHYDDDHHCEHHQRTTAFERGMMMIINKPEILKEGAVIVAEFWRTLKSPDDLALKAASDQIAAHAAQAVQDKLADLMRDEGYSVGEDGEIVSPDELQAEEVEELEELQDDEELEELQDDEELEELQDENLEDLEEELEQEDEELQDEETKLTLHVVEADDAEEEVTHGVHSLGT